MYSYRKRNFAIWPSNTYFTNKYTDKLRNHILENTSILEIINYQDTVFNEAGVDVATIILNKLKLSDNKIKILDTKTNTELLKSQIDWEKDKNKIFNINKTLLFKLKNTIKLEDIYSVTFGLQTKNKSIYISETKKDNDWENCYTGKDISRYYLQESNLFFKNNPKEVKAGGSWNMEYHKSKKIVVRQVGNPEPIFAYDNFLYPSLNTIYNIVNKSEKFNDLYILSILNSNFIKYYWNCIYKDNKDLFPKIKGFQLKELPIKDISLNEQQPFILLADRMLKLTKEFNDKSQKFQRTIMRRFDLEKLSNKLKIWYDLDYKNFVKELKKDKIKLSLSEEADWEEYFVSEKEQINKLREQINKTDEEINNLVYQLYNLTD